MDLQAQRRLIAKYGKSKNRVVGVNFFDDPKPAIAIVAPVSKKYPISPSSAGEQSSKEDASARQSIVREPSLSPVKPAHVTSHSRSVSPVKVAQKSQTSDAASFDILSSDDEAEMASKRPLKKLRLTQTMKQPKSRPADQIKAIPKAKTSRIVLKKKQENVAPPQLERPQDARSQQEKVIRSDMTRAVEIKAAPVSKASPLVNSNNADSTMRTLESPPSVTMGNTGNIEASSKEKQRGKMQKQIVSPRLGTKSRTQLKRVSQEHSIAAHTNDEYQIDMSDTDDRPVQKKRSYVKTKSAQEATPKRRRQLSPARSETSAASPGSRLFSELRLSPSKSPAPAFDREISLSPIHSPVRRGRLRRIDRLDAPAEPISLPSTRPPSVQRSLSSVRASAINHVDDKKPDSTVSRPALSRSNSSQTKVGYGKSRNTYGRERSHLADMLDDLDVLSDNSQDASQKFASQLAANSGPSQLQMELDLDSSSGDEGVAPLKLKSIHELRQAGSNDRFSRDLEGILLDIDPTASGATKSLRLQACIRLFTKLSQEAFAIFILDQGLDRLIAWSKAVDDKISQLLLNMIFWRLIHIKGASPVRVKSILQTVAASTALIVNFGSFTGLVKDRKENLSKQMIRDLSAFESQVFTTKLLPEYGGQHIVPAAIVLAALHDALQKLVQAGLSNVNMGGQSIKKITSILVQVSQQTSNRSPEDRFITRTVLSLLKLFCGPLESDLGLNNAEYIALGNCLGDIGETAAEGGHEDLLQSVLHLTINLCNERLNVCKQIATSTYIDFATSFTNNRFSKLIKAADDGHEIDTAMLDSIILCLASLLNVSENHDTVRAQVAHQKSGFSASTHLASLIETYVKAAPLAETATTAEKIQLRIAFGYLALLLCNLCLDDGVWTEAQRLLGLAQLAILDVVASAKELLIYLHAVESSQSQTEIIDEETTVAVDGLTLRFGAILAAVRIT